MPSKRLEEAMKRTRYSHEKVNKGASGVTGKADEEPKPAPRQPYTKERKEAVEETARVRPAVYRKPKGPRNTTAREINRNGVEGDEVFKEEPGTDERAPRPSGRRLPPDPFPLEYRQGDPDKEFECE